MLGTTKPANIRKSQTFPALSCGFLGNLPGCLTVNYCILVHDGVCLRWSKSVNFNCIKQIRNQEMEHLLKQLGRFYVSLWQVRGISTGINDEEMRVIIMIVKPNIFFLWIFNIYWILKAEGKQKVVLHSVQAFFSPWLSVLKKERCRKLPFSRIYDKFSLS